MTAKMSLRDLIAEASDIRAETVNVPEWGVDVEVRSMSMRARAAMFAQSAAGGALAIEKFYPAILIACCYDPKSGEKVFGADDLDMLADKSAGPVERLAKLALSVSGMSDEAVDEGKDGS